MHKAVIKLGHVCLACAAITGLNTAGVMAGDWKPDRIHLQFGSKHINMDTSSRNGGFDEFNPGILLTWENRKFGLNYTIGAFRNSYGSVAPTVGVSKMWSMTPDLRMGLFGGLAYYGEDAGLILAGAEQNGIIPLVGSQVTYKNAYVQFIPSDDSRPGPGLLIVAGATFPFGKE